MGERLEKKLREKRKREKREKRERDGLYFKIFNIFSNSFFSVIFTFSLRDIKYEIHNYHKK